MRIPVIYSEYRFALKSHRLGIIHLALRRGQTPREHTYIDHKKIIQHYKHTTAADLHRWSQYLKRNYPEHNP